MKAVVVGQGYVGLPLALRAVEAGLTVVGFDIHGGLVHQLNRGVSHIDDVSDSDLGAALTAGYRASSDETVIAQADVVAVCVPTPLSPSGGPDLTAVEDAARTVGRYVRSGATVVLESTTYPGTTEEIFAPLVLGERLTLDTDVHIAYSPERVDPGNRHYGIRNTPKVVGGLTPASTDAAVDFYSRFIDTVVPARGAKEAEMAKLLENTFRHVNIALVNEMVRFSDELDIDLWDAIDCAETKPFGFMAFRPGPGVGGHCIPVDPSYLSHRVKARLGYAFRMVELAEEINGAAPGYVATRVWRVLNEHGRSVRGATVLLVGVTYKADIADRRESPADPLAAKLLGWGARVSYHDPFVPRWSPRGLDDTSLVSTDDVYAGAAASDVVVLLQAHATYDLDRLATSGTPIIDTRGQAPAGANVHRL